MYVLYRTLLGLALVFSAPWWLLRMARHGKYRAGLRERLGSVPHRVLTGGSRRTIWIHAVSVGEVLAVANLIAKLREQWPEHRVVISTTTQTGQELARQRFGAENVFYFPLDFAFCIRPYLNSLRPELLILAETEFWPNLLRLARNSGAKIAVVNARISDRSLPRYRRWRGLLRRVLENIDVFCVQTDEDARRLRQIGAPPGRLQISGNLKFDMKPAADAPSVAQLRAAIQHDAARPVIVCGSTTAAPKRGQAPEESVIVDAFARALKQFPSALLVLAPRHPERFGEVAELLRSRGMRFCRRSELPLSGENLAGAILLLDSVGELAATYELADVAFVGGSLVARGGHNILEPAYFGKPIMVGPHTENFRDIVELFRRAGALVETDRTSFAAELVALLNDPNRRAELGNRAATLIRSQQGATERTLDALRPLFAHSQTELAVEGAR